MGPGCQAKNQQPRVGISKARHRFCPVVPIKVSAALDLTHLAAMRNQSRTERTCNDFVIKRSEIGGLKRSTTGPIKRSETGGINCCHSTLGWTARHLLKFISVRLSDCSQRSFVRNRLSAVVHKRS